MQMVKESSKRIAKNTALLYFRMLLIMVVSLYTSRIVLQSLGIIDFGIYNVVGSVVTMFSLFSGTMSNATQRFLNFETGRNNQDELRKVFSVSLNLYFKLAFIIFVLIETAGLWFLETQLIIPNERMSAARWIFQLSLLSFILGTLQIPFNASIIAHEDMKVYAYISVFEVILKLVLVVMLTQIAFDKLKLYAILMFCVSLIIMVLYISFCLRKYPECHYKYVKDKVLSKSITDFARWNLFGAIAYVGLDQGINLLLNIFFGPAINAARGVAFQVKTAVYGFVQNFQTAVNPQLVKLYATDDRTSMLKLIFQSSKYSFFLLYLVVCPILIETDFILDLWLKDVPAYSVLFCRLILILSLIDCLSGPLITAAGATGTIKRYQILVGSTLLMVVPLSYLFLRLGYSAEITLIINIFISIIAFVIRLFLLKGLIGLPVLTYFKEVLLKILVVVLLSAAVPYFVLNFLPMSFQRFLIASTLSLFFNALIIAMVGVNVEERSYLIRKLKSISFFSK